MQTQFELPADLSSSVRRALSEDIGTGDLTADLISPGSTSHASVICREEAVLCGVAWFTETFRQIDESVKIHWHVNDSALLSQDQIVCELEGPSRAILSGERTALNFLQLLSGTATCVNEFVKLITNTRTKILDTRKTIPGLRSAQKYAVLCGGGMNHRMGLYDGILIKENHIRAAGSITAAVTAAQEKHRSIEVEVETLAELEEAISIKADTVLLDNFSVADMQEAVKIAAGQVVLEVSGGVTLERVAEIAATGVDYISVGSLTKNVMAIDFSMQIN